MIQEIIIAVLLITSLAFLARTVIRSIRTGKSCEAGCGKCSASPDRRLVP